MSDLDFPPQNIRYKLLKNYALLAQKTKVAMEKALQNFTTLAQEEVGMWIV
jgi:hypothetical protein